VAAESCADGERFRVAGIGCWRRVGGHLGRHSGQGMLPSPRQAVDVGGLHASINPALRGRRGPTRTARGFAWPGVLHGCNVWGE
jgi:hypothetical protein